MQAYDADFASPSYLASSVARESSRIDEGERRAVLAYCQRPDMDERLRQNSRQPAKVLQTHRRQWRRSRLPQVWAALDEIERAVDFERPQMEESLRQDVRQREGVLQTRSQQQHQRSGL